jgi:cytidyltransferase-like protein
MRRLTVLVNGVFDLFHSGHETLFNYAIKFMGEDGQLLIGINSDESVQKLKGPQRPIETCRLRRRKVKEFLIKQAHELERTILCSFFEFDTEEELLNKISAYQVDMLVKGNDRTDVSQITGNQICPVVIIPRTDISTTQIIQENGWDFL